MQARRNWEDWVGGGGCSSSSPSKLLLTSIFDELKKIVLK